MTKTTKTTKAEKAEGKKVSDNQKPEDVQEVQQGQNTYKVGDEIVVTGKCYSNATPGGMFRKVEQCKMYITQVLDAEKYANPIGVARNKGGTRYGWVNEANIMNE